jgi:hypothetical protein
VKTAKHLKDEIDLMANARKANEFNELVEFVEMRVKESIHWGNKKTWIRPHDNKIDQYFDRIKPILENSGYTIERVQVVTHTEHRLFGKDIEQVTDFIEIKWE